MALCTDNSVGCCRFDAIVVMRRGRRRLGGVKNQGSVLASARVEERRLLLRLLLRLRLRLRWDEKAAGDAAKITIFASIFAIFSVAIFADMESVFTFSNVK